MTKVPQLRITTTTAAAAQLGVTRMTVNNMLQDGRLKGYCTGTRGKWFVYQESIEALMGISPERGRSYLSSSL